MNGKKSVRVPDVEIIIGALGSDVGVVGFYFPSSPHDAVEVVASIAETGDREHLVALLHQAIACLNGEDWYTLAELDTRPAEDEAAPPF